MDDDDDGLIMVELHHGGKYIRENAYFGGTVEIMAEYDPTDLLFEELESFMKRNGYHSVLKYATRKVGDIEEYVFFHDEASLNECMDNDINWENKCFKL